MVFSFFCFSSEVQPSIVGVWINEKDPKLTWEFNASGQLIEKYGEEFQALPRTPSTYQILDYSQSCSKYSTDSSDQKYLKITDPELGSFCYYLETLSDEVLVIMKAGTGKMLIFNRQN
ncbi:hypothetical protein [Algoriphagus sp. CAU 1675]|uniref:hypothetical protein n=1 Tax=Algoriphagus sp. CAU 1675 TaxID=3032597 RepID=UPI0023DB7F3E|nr:hypothetical protein [Algoriphagus sp. CAU 1675]MDF2157475.1 hypothetical protein [Algoriphagus sp. CAU 1675]